MSHYPGYWRWKNVINRCFNEKDPDYPNYGGRGITVCERWKSFPLYWEDMGAPPEGMQLEREDNDGNYEPGNVVWATPLEQAQNRRPKYNQFGTNDLIQEIRGRHEHGESYKSIAARVDLTYHYVYKVVKNARWRE